MRDRTTTIPEEEPIQKHIPVEEKMINVLKKKDHTSKQISKITQMSTGTINNIAVRMEIKGTLIKTKCPICELGVLLHLKKTK